MNFDPEEPAGVEYVSMGKFAQKSRSLESYSDFYYYDEDDRSILSRICSKRVLCGILTLFLLLLALLSVLMLVAVVRTLMLEDPYKRWELSDGVVFKGKMKISKNDKIQMADR